MTNPVPHTELIRNETVRRLAGGITRHTLLAWRDTQDFPQPLNVDGIDLWDQREVTAWLKAREKARRARSRRS